MSEKGVGKCEHGHLGSYGYPSRPSEPYAFCAQCGHGMIWKCPRCGADLPEDSGELISARFCRYCGESYFEPPEPEVVP